MSNVIYVSPPLDKFLRGIAARLPSALLYLFAFYLIATSLIATQIFDEKSIQPISDLLEKNLSEIGLNIPVTEGPSDEVMTNITASLNKNILSQQLGTYNSNLKIFIRTLQAQPTTFVSMVGKKRTYPKQLFSEISYEHELARMAEIYASNIIIALNKWIDAWVYQERACHDAIENAEVTLSGFVSKVNAALRENPNGERALPFCSDPPSLSQQCDFSTLLLNPIIPKKPDFIQSYGPFGALTGWPVKVGSPDLVLIIGLFGFGLFGALAASAIRQNVPQVGRLGINTAFVRGILRHCWFILLLLADWRSSQGETQAQIHTRCISLA